MNMTEKEQKIAQVTKQMDDLFKQIKELATDKLKNAYNASPEEFKVLDSENFLLSKAVVDSVCRDRPVKSFSYKAEFDNIHSSC